MFIAGKPQFYVYSFIVLWLEVEHPPAPNCIKCFIDLPGDSGQSGLMLQLFPMETIATSNLIGQNNQINQWKCFIQLSVGDQQVTTQDRHLENGDFNLLSVLYLWKSLPS